jgi:uncharacterized membrane protein
MRKFLKRILVIQEKTVIDSFKEKTIKRRLNPYNPITYIVIFLAFILAIIMFGVIGFVNEIDFNDVKFKWK